MSELSFIEHTFEDQTEPNISSANLFQGNNLDSLFKNDSIFSGDYSLETRSKLQQLVESFEYIPGANGAKRLKLGQEDDEYPTDIDHIQGFDVSIDLKSSPNKMVVSFNSAFLGTLGGDQNMVFNQDLKVWHENKDYSYQDQSEKSIDYDLESNNNDFEFDQAEKDLNEIDQNMLDSLDYASCKEFTLPNDSQSFIRIPTNVTDVVTPRKSDLVTPVKDSSFGILQRDTMGLFNLKGSTPMSATKYASLQEDVSMSAIKNNSQQDSIGLFNLKGSTPVSAIKNNSQHDSIGLFDLKGNTPVSAIKNISQHDLNSLDTPVHSNDHHVSTFEDTFDQVDEKHLIETRAFLNTNETNNTPYHEPNKTFQDLDQKFQSLANIVIEEDSILVKAPTESIFKQSKQKEPIESIFTQSKQKQSNQNFQSRELFKSDLKSNTMDTYRSTASESNQDTILVHLVKALNLTTTWKSLTSLNLSNQNLNNIVGLDSTIPHLETLDISNNRIKFLKGIPRSVKYLNAKQNCIDDSTSFSGCDGLLELNCSYNLLKSTNSVSILNRLRVLDLSFNYLESLDLPSNIVDLNVSHNRIKILDGLNGNFKVLNVSFNLIENVDVSALVEDFDLAGNLLTRLDLKHLRNLKRLDVSRNSISELNVDANIVIADFNPLLNFNASCNLERFNFLECIRLSELKITETRFDLSNLEDIKSLVRLELVNCGITSLENIARSTLPNIKHLDLSNNRIECISPLSKLSTLTCLNLSNNIVKDFSKVLKTVCKFKKLEWFDFRFNLSTRNFYSSNADFIEHEKMYIKTLTDVLFVKRLLYRSSILCSFKYLTWFDGSSVDLEEKRRSCFNVERLKKVMKKKSGKDVLKNPENLIAARSRIQSVALSAKDLVVDESGFSDWKPVSYPLKGAGSAVYLANEV